MSDPENEQNKKSEQDWEEITLHPTILKEFKLEENKPVKADKKFRLAHKLYVDLVEDIGEFEKIDEGFKDTCGKVNFIREFCVIEYLLRRDRSHPRYSFNYFGAVVLSLDHEWWRYKIFESLNSLADARNNVAHTFDYGGEYKSGDQDTSVLNKDYVQSTGRKILKLLFLRMIDKNLQSTTLRMQDKWYSKLDKKKKKNGDKRRNFSKNEVRKKVEPLVKKFHEGIPRSRFEDMIKKVLDGLFGTPEIPKESYTIGINAYGGLVLKMNNMINLLSYFHTEDEISAHYRRLPNEKGFQGILTEISNAINNLSNLDNGTAFNSEVSSKKKICLFNKSPLALVFAFGWYYKREGIENNLMALLEIRGSDKENPISTYVEIKAECQTSTSERWEVSTKESQQEKILILVKFKEDRVEKIREDYPHYHIVEINPKGNFIVSEEKEVYEYAGELKEILQSFAEESDHINLALRLPTPLVLQLAYILADSEISITIYRDDSRRYGEEEKLHKLFTLE